MVSASSALTSAPPIDGTGRRDNPAATGPKRDAAGHRDEDDVLLSGAPMTDTAAEIGPKQTTPKESLSCAPRRSRDHRGDGRAHE